MDHSPYISLNNIADHYTHGECRCVIHNIESAYIMYIIWGSMAKRLWYIKCKCARMSDIRVHCTCAREIEMAFFDDRRPSAVPFSKGFRWEVIIRPWRLLKRYTRAQTHTLMSVNDIHISHSDGISNQYHIIQFFLQRRILIFDFFFIAIK